MKGPYGYMAEAHLHIDDCWNRIGTWRRGDEQCPYLNDVVHCQNCSIYSEAGRKLLDRPAAQDDQDEATENLRSDKRTDAADERAALVFRIGDEWFALDTTVVLEITEMRTVHSLPHLRTNVIRGLMTIRGELQICVSLGALLGVEKSTGPRQEYGKIRQRLVVIERNGERFAFPASEIANIHEFRDQDIEIPPSTLTSASATFVKGLLELENCRAGYLDDELLFRGLTKSLG